MLVFLGVFAFRLTWASVAESRGFGNSKCYRHIVYYQTRGDRCVVDLFRDSTFQISFQSNCLVGETANQYYMVDFKYDKNSAGAESIKILKHFIVDEQLNLSLGNFENGMAFKINCKISN